VIDERYDIQSMAFSLGPFQASGLLRLIQANIPKPIKIMTTNVLWYLV
jgi:hypothetical protein